MSQTPEDIVKLVKSPLCFYAGNLGSEVFKFFDSSKICKLNKVGKHLIFKPKQ